MSEPAAARQLATALAFAYPFIAHLAIARASIALTIAAIALLLTIILLPALAARRASAWLAVPLAGIGCWWLSRTSVPALPLYVPPVLVPAFMAWVFGHTLLRGRTPLISQLISLLHADDDPGVEVWSYARRLTFFWTLFFIALACLNLLLAAFAEPNGLLLAAGITPPLTVPLEWWSLFANLIGYLLVAAFFAIEYAYRRRRFPQQPYRNMIDFLRRTFAVMPRLLRRTQS
jgi:uncharacterized membrane protein